MCKILLLYDYLMAVGGAERLFLEEERFLRERGYDVTAVAFELDPKALFDYQPEKLLHLKAKGHLTRLARLVKLIWSIRPDLVVAPSNSEAIYLFLANWLAPVRYAVHVHGSHFWFETDKLKYAWLHRKVFDPHARAFARLHGFPPHHLSVAKERQVESRDILGVHDLELAGNVKRGLRRHGGGRFDGAQRKRAHALIVAKPNADERDICLQQRGQIPAMHSQIHRE